VGPGVFKSVPNRVGNYVFVEPELVEGTLLRAFGHYDGLISPLSRALFMMFAVSEIHPFADANGRIARIMMNAELVTAAQPRIIIPTVYRDTYLSGLRALSTGGRASPLFAVLDFAQRWTNQIDWSAFEISLEQLEAANAFVDPTEAETAGIRLQLQPQR
jgi:fido (protein-threonine AMPylation protein)